jgi:hypothetical protein
MKTATDLPAVLTVHEASPGQYVLRIGDLRWRPLVVGVSKLLDDAKSLIVVTPGDIKVLRVSGTESESEGTAVASPLNAGPAAADPDAQLDQETLAAIKEQEEHPPLSAEPDEGAPVVKAEAGMRVVRRSKPNGRAGHAEVCGRCRGEGSIRIIEEGGSPGQAPCGVCQGTGQITRYGARR